MSSFRHAQTIMQINKNIFWTFPRNLIATVKPWDHCKKEKTKSFVNLVYISCFLICFSFFLLESSLCDSFMICISQCSLKCYHSLRSQAQSSVRKELIWFYFLAHFAFYVWNFQILMCFLNRFLECLLIDLFLSCCLFQCI